MTQTLLSYRHQLVASPDYLAGRPAPKTPEDLVGHPLLTFSHWKPDNHWLFVRRDGRERRTVTFLSRLSVNDYDGLAARLLAGDGIGDLPPVVRPDPLRDGRLVEIMPDWRFPTHDPVLLHMGRRHAPRPPRAFKELALRMAPSLFPALPA